MLRIGHISYANCTPIFYALKRYHDCSNYTFWEGVPSELNRLLLRGELDVSPSSSIELACHPDLYQFLPDLSISSFGKVRSIILFSKVPIEELDGERVATSQASTTSSILLRIIMSEFFHMENIFQEVEGELKEVLKNYKAFLLIGDNALKAVISCKLINPPIPPLVKGGEGGLYMYDLGELWYRFTQLPFVFALWLVRKDSLEKKGEEIERFKGQLLSAKDIAYRSYAEISEVAEERSWISKERLIDYWRKISYDLSDYHLEGLRRFYDYAKKLSLIKKVPFLEFNNFNPRSGKMPDLFL
jgi:chorismate dehydratase